LVVVGEGEDVAFGEAGEVAEGLLEDGFGVGDVEEGGGLRLELDEGAGGEVGGFDLEEVTGVEGEGLHYLGLRYQLEVSSVGKDMVRIPTQYGKYILPSSAMNSSTPVCVIFSLLPLMSSNSMGYVICSRVSLSRALGGMKTFPPWLTLSRSGPGSMTTG